MKDAARALRDEIRAAMPWLSHRYQVERIAEFIEARDMKKAREQDVDRTFDFTLRLRPGLDETPEVRAWLDACKQKILTHPKFARRWEELERRVTEP